MNHINTLSAGNILIGIVVLALKYAANALTATVARLSDAIESIVSRVWEGAGKRAGRAIWIWPMTFVAALLAGFVVASTNVAKTPSAKVISTRASGDV